MNEPSAFSANDDACAGPVTSTAVSVGRVDVGVVASTPGAATFSVPPSGTLYGPSLTATGASLTGVMVMLTVATFELSEPSFAW